MNFVSKPIARFWSRCVKGTGGQHDGLIIGSQFKDASIFEENTVYEARLCGLTGDIIMKKIGPAAVKGDNVTQRQVNMRGYVSGYNYCHISQRYYDIVSGKYCFLTENELYDSVYEQMMIDLRLSSNDRSVDHSFIDCAHFIKKD